MNVYVLIHRFLIDYSIAIKYFDLATLLWTTNKSK